MLTAPEPWLLFCGLQIYVHVTACLHARPPIHGSAELLTCQKESHLIANPHGEFPLISAVFFLSILGCCLLLRTQSCDQCCFLHKTAALTASPIFGVFCSFVLPLHQKERHCKFMLGGFTFWFKPRVHVSSVPCMGLHFSWLQKAMQRQ